MLEFLLELIPGVRIEYVSSEVDLLIGNATLLEVILFLITMFLVVAFSEEILFRGFQQKGLMFNLNPKKGILVGALIFSLIHLVGVFFSIIFSPVSFLIEFILTFFPYFVISIILAYLFYWRNENLIAVIITHGLYNSLTIFMAYLLFNLENLIISYILILLVVLGISLILYYVLNNFYK
jgi:membrane protease YdiL (CAAX protease family)